MAVSERTRVDFTNRWTGRATSTLMVQRTARRRYECMACGAEIAAEALYLSGPNAEKVCEGCPKAHVYG